MNPKYSVEETGPRIEQFLHEIIANGQFDLKFKVEPGEQAHPDFENPDIVVKFTGEDVDLLLANRAEFLLALELVTQESLGCIPTITRGFPSTPTIIVRCGSKSCA